MDCAIADDTAKAPQRIPEENQWQDSRMRAVMYAVLEGNYTNEAERMALLAELQRRIQWALEHMDRVGVGVQEGEDV